MTSWASRALPVLLRFTGRTRAYQNAQSAQEHIDQRALRPQPYGPPAKLRTDVAVAVQRRGSWPIYTLTPRTASPRRAVVYLHGGAWVNEITPQHWHLVAQIAAEAQATVIVPIYPLVPFATAAQVVPAVVDLVADQVSGGGPVCLTGDSAGGQIALSAALLLRDDHGAVLPRTILISPVVDLSLSNPDIAAVEPTDPWLGRDALRVFAERWRADLPLTDLRVAPLAADLAGLGPLTIFTGTRDLLNPDAHVLAEQTRAAGVSVEFHEEPGLLHVYPLMPTPEGRAARAVIVEELKV
ncbi:esterase [Mycobacterium kubicae]|uniref:Alpha/beta hydrolase fold domain-containing protein n=1 Tax=Mycobacterium kubicae TaxID=120959 RepID=A0AAX1J352_9MYCO|nr:alpha/beta hydrolase [Mycobacterium kubicae]MCV7098123.1 alpha/beta hydrolase fold domain-containing protein [Mycobacterium kubicae]ORW03503.1 esterase [Mycobacterium kubicae]QNI12324.1 alpha/beta hydrolase [Mycobacterium kubicae]QPI35841.1 alpha/beta hydrolase fold domain-containing protein [Mycobacterium kubicae]GFG65329.1 esterase [Mycobacterium kubicae]